MFSLGKRKCEFCKKKIENSKEIQADVEVYGIVGTHKRFFCSQEHLEQHKRLTSKLMKARRPNVCKRRLGWK